MQCPSCGSLDMARDVSTGAWNCMDCGGGVDSDPTVWMTLGSGQTYHATSSCGWLRKGQEAVERRGGEAAPLRSLPRSGAQAQGKAPCNACTPADWRQ